MASPLARLRADLDVMPSPLPEQPGLILRDPFRYSTVTLVIPPLLARCLSASTASTMKTICARCWPG